MMIGTDITQRTISFGLHRTSIRVLARVAGGFSSRFIAIIKNAGVKRARDARRDLGQKCVAGKGTIIIINYLQTINFPL